MIIAYKHKIELVTYSDILEFVKIASLADGNVMLVADNETSLCRSHGYRIEEVIYMANELVCNKCGKKFDLWDTQENFTIKTRLGYGTKYDGDELDIKLCCNCMETFIDECVISPIAEKNNT